MMTVVYADKPENMKRTKEKCERLNGWTRQKLCARNRPGKNGKTSEKSRKIKKKSS